MAINVDHSGQLAGRLPVLGLRTGQLQYQDRRRQEEEERQLQLARLSQNQQQLDQNYSLNQQRLAQNSNQFSQGLQARFAGMALGAQLDQQQQTSAHSNRLDLLRQQQEDSLERADVNNEYYRQRDMINMGMQGEIQDRQQFRTQLNGEGRNLYEDFDRRRHSVMSDATLTPDQKQYAIGKLTEEEQAIDWDKYQPQAGIDPGTRTVINGYSYFVDETGRRVPEGPAFGPQYEHKSFGEWVDAHKAQVGDGASYLPRVSRNGELSLEKFGDAPPPLTPKEEIEIQYKEAQIRQMQSAEASDRLKQFTELKKMTVKGNDGSEKSLYEDDEKAWAIVDRAYGKKQHPLGDSPVDRWMRGESPQEPAPEQSAEDKLSRAKQTIEILMETPPEKMNSLEREALKEAREEIAKHAKGDERSTWQKITDPRNMMML